MGQICADTLKLVSHTFSWQYYIHYISSYEGEVVQGLRHGQGCFYCAISQTTYVGHWCLGRRHGRGQLTHDSSHSSYYDGEWVNDMKQGYGIEVYK